MLSQSSSGRLSLPHLATKTGALGGTSHPPISGSTDRQYRTVAPETRWREHLDSWVPLRCCQRKRLATSCTGGSLLALVLISRIAWVDQRLNRLIKRFIRRYTDLETRDLAGLLDLSGEYAVSELAVSDDDWAAGRQLHELALRDEGIAVLVSRVAMAAMSATRPEIPRSRAATS